jgi:membrane protease YdiL (CAAX protease family)
VATGSDVPADLPANSAADDSGDSHGGPAAPVRGPGWPYGGPQGRPVLPGALAFAFAGLVVAVLVQSLLAPALLAAAGASIHDDPDTYSIPAVALLSVPFWFTLVTWAVGYSRLRGAGPLLDYRLTGRPVDVPLGLAVGVFAQAVLVSALYWPIIRWTSMTTDDIERDACSLTTRAKDTHTAGILLFLLVVVVMAPLVEELYFRGMLLGALQRHLGAVPAVAVSAFVFALAHFQGPQFPALFLFGAIAGSLRVRTGRLAPSVLAHVGFNAWTAFYLLHGTSCHPLG